MRLQTIRIGGGIALCMIGLLLIDANKWLPGLFCFVGGFLLMMKPRFRR